MKVAIVHDWLLGMRGGERCLEVFLEMFPEADLYTAFYDKRRVSRLINSKKIKTSVLQAIPGATKFHRYLLPLYPMASRSLSSQLAEKEYELVISISHCLAKNITVPENAFHLCYCLTPMRYIWDQYDSYFADKWYEPLVRLFTKTLRKWDVAGAADVDCFVGISDFVCERIKRVYGRKSEVIYPPVRTDWIAPIRQGINKAEGFLCVSALVPYKRVDAIVAAFNKLPYTLTVVGDGPEKSKIEKMAGPSIRFVGKLEDSQLASLYRQSRALIFAAEEDFGMVPVEMQATGRPVICLGKGGSLETVIGDGEFKTGLFFDSPGSESIINAVKQFVVSEGLFTVDNCINHAAKFSEQNFSTKFWNLLDRVGVLRSGSLNRDVEKTLAAI